MNNNLEILIADHNHLISEIIALLYKINNNVYNKNSSFLINHSIGKHFRHIYDFYIQFCNGFENKNIYYDDRKRNSELESNCNAMIKGFEQIQNKINIKENFDLIIHYQLQNNLKDKIKSNIIRELVFIYSHSIHHLAMIRTVLENEHGFVFSNNMGFSLSTIKHKEVSLSK